MYLLLFVPMQFSYPVELCIVQDEVSNIIDTVCILKCIEVNHAVTKQTKHTSLVKTT